MVSTGNLMSHLKKDLGFILGGIISHLLHAQNSAGYSEWHWMQGLDGKEFAIFKGREKRDIYISPRKH